MFFRFVIILFTALPASFSLQAETAMEKNLTAKKCVVEIRSYDLVPGKGEEFHRLVTEKVIPLLQQWKNDVITYGPSLDNNDVYYLMRAYKDEKERERQQDDFYSSPEWRDGPRDKILEMIHNYTTVLLHTDCNQFRSSFLL